MDVKTALELAVSRHQAGQFELAEPLYRQILKHEPRNLDAKYLLGTLLLQRRQLDASIELLEEVCRERADVPDVLNNLGIAYHARGRHAPAEAAFRRTLAAAPHFEQAWFNLGTLHEELGRFQTAEECYRQAFELNPDDAQTIYNLAQCLKAQFRWEEAADAFQKALTLRPDDSDLLAHLGYVLVKLDRLDEAAAAFEQIVEIEPDFAEIHNNLSYVFERQGRLIRAEFCAREAIRLQPDYAEAFNNLGTALRSQRKFVEAVEAFSQAIALKPALHLAAFNLGTTRLLCGDLPAGWKDYERRTGLDPGAVPTRGLPRWNGAPGAAGLVVMAEQGFGDLIFAARFLPLAAQRLNGPVILEAPRGMAGLLRRGLVGPTPWHAAAVVSPGEALPEGVHGAASGVWCELPLMSLPGLLGTTLENIPAHVPYLAADASRTNAWRRWLRARAPGKRFVGICWQGNRRQARDALRSMPPAELAPLADVPEIAIVSLQTTENGIVPPLPPGLPLLDPTASLTDFAATADLVAALDLVLSVDTAVCHLAGALGIPVWTLLAYAADWRWHDARTDSPWYPTMTLFRQPEWGDWGSVIQSVCARLAEGAITTGPAAATPGAETARAARADR